VQALACARRLELLAQALLAGRRRAELAGELRVRLLVLVELGAAANRGLLGLLGANAQALDLGCPLRGARRRGPPVRCRRPPRPAGSAASTARSAARAATSPRSCSRSACSSVTAAAGRGSGGGGGAATGALGASTGSPRAPRRTASIITARSPSGRSSVRTSR